MSHGGADREVLAKVFGYGLAFCRRFDDDKMFGHFFKALFECGMIALRHNSGRPTVYHFKKDAHGERVEP
jgi:hypothetical protein